MYTHHTVDVLCINNQQQKPNKSNCNKGDFFKKRFTIKRTEFKQLLNVINKPDLKSGLWDINVDNLPGNYNIICSLFKYRISYNIKTKTKPGDYKCNYTNTRPEQPVAQNRSF